MSTVIKTLTPFLNKQLLLESLIEEGHQFIEQNEQIHLQNIQGYSRTYFEQSAKGDYLLVADSHTRTKKILQNLAKTYAKIYQKKTRAAQVKRLQQDERQKIQADQAQYEATKRQAETERLAAEKLEQERKNYVALQKKAILERAEKLGYEVQEIRKNKATQFVLVRRG